ncbi:hypothetical protein ICJ78_16275 [Komagataeibacter rhaeticus]|nr:hypothetical protein ICJ78_16275 [Komagataeibacter rhaeticus]SAY46960.1 hypothetical protein KRIGEM_03508 [Komagataeibacter rhaeticus]
MPEQLLGLGDGLLQRRKGGIRQAGKVARLVGKHRGLVEEALGLLIDLLQFTGGNQDVLDMICPVVDGPLGAG